uniref:tRNA-guanine(15) transglycosylase-like domain-containing protein n=1 Tax=Ditylenchus dipsaci TaxID=166011 RepID=A0A915DJB5_9BILA
MKFEVKTSMIESKTIVGRLGRLVEFTEDNTQSVCTPAYMIYTRAGHIPHLTWHVFDKYHSDLSTVSLIDLQYHSKIQRMRCWCIKFLQNSGKLAFTSYHMDQLSAQECGFNKCSSVSIWSKGGRQDISPASLKVALNAIRPHSYSTPFDYDTSRDCKNKRMIKSIERTIDWCDQLCSEKDDDYECSPFLSLGGGFSSHYRSKLAKELCSRAYAKAFTIDLSSFSLSRPFSQAEGENLESVMTNNFDEAEVKLLLADVMTELAPGSARMVEGPFDPHQIFTLIQLGIDIFDSSYAIWLAQQGRGFKLTDDYPSSSSGFKVVDFNDNRYRNDFTPPFDCVCYSCINYSKSYLQHLQNAKEMLAQILLVVHNLQEFDKMFARLREFGEKHWIS